LTRSDLFDESDDSVVPLVVEALSLQVRLQIELLRAEIDRDLWALGRRLMPFGVAFPLLALGYVFCSVATALAIAGLVAPLDLVLGLALGAAVIGLLNLALGSGIALLAARKAREGEPSPQRSWSSNDE
jgi:hypothetical protein